MGAGVGVSGIRLIVPASSWVNDTLVLHRPKQWKGMAIYPNEMVPLQIDLAIGRDGTCSVARRTQASGNFAGTGRSLGAESDAELDSWADPDQGIRARIVHCDVHRCVRLDAGAELPWSSRRRRPWPAVTRRQIWRAGPAP